MATINKNYNKLQSGYLFVEVGRRIKDFAEKNPGVKIMRLGVGDTTEPLSRTIIKGLKKGVEKLSNVKTYTGYQDAEGKEKLRTEILLKRNPLGVMLDLGFGILDDATGEAAARVIHGGVR